jgi:GNAT superfamily N-acetyltransferase
VKIEIFREETPRFWLLMGKYFAYRSFAFEMGGWQFYTKPFSVWFIALDENDNVLGFCSAINEGRYYFFDNFYVNNEYRGIGTGSELHKIRDKEIKLLNKEIRVISDNPIQIKKYQQYGFIFNGNRGRYHKYKWNPNKASTTDKDGVSCAESMESK